MALNVVLRNNIYLIGDISLQPHFENNKLPSNKKVLQLFFYKTRTLKNNVTSSINSTVAEVVDQWDKLNIPTVTVRICKQRLSEFYEEYRTIQKNKSTEAGQFREQTFCKKLDAIFDISPQDILDRLDEQKLQLFLRNDFAAKLTSKKEENYNSSIFYQFSYFATKQSIFL